VHPEEDTLTALQQAEARLLEISALQTELVAQLTRQTEVSDQVYEDTVTTSEIMVSPQSNSVQLDEACSSHVGNGKPYGL
jgi:syntaxin 18